MNVSYIVTMRIFVFFQQKMLDLMKFIKMITLESIVQVINEKSTL